MRKVLILAPLLATVLLPGCSSTRLPGIYKLDIQQGNIVTKDQLSRLEPGMEQRKVRFILGTPMLVDVFNQNRWDYVYEFRPGTSGEVVRRRVALYFENERLTVIDGELLDAPAGDPDARDRVVSVPDMPRDTGFLSALNPFADDPSNPPRDSSDEVPQPAAIEVIDMDEEAAAPPMEPMETTAAPLREAEVGSPTQLEAAHIDPEEQKEDEDGGFFRRLAERFGFGDSETPAETTEQ